jgi:hypothetical protein
MGTLVPRPSREPIRGVGRSAYEGYSGTAQPDGARTAQSGIGHICGSLGHDWNKVQQVATTNARLAAQGLQRDSEVLRDFGRPG